MDYYQYLTKEKCAQLNEGYSKFTSMAIELQNRGIYCTAKNVRDAFVRNNIKKTPLYERVKEYFLVSSEEIAKKFDVSVASVEKIKAKLRAINYKPQMSLSYKITDKRFKVYCSGHTKPEVCAFVSAMVQYLVYACESFYCIEKLVFADENEDYIKHFEIARDKSSERLFKTFISIMRQIANEQKDYICLTQLQ